MLGEDPRAEHRRREVPSVSSTVTLSYNLAGELTKESWSGGSLDGLSVTNGFDSLLRRTNLTAPQSRRASTCNPRRSEGQRGRASTK
jgi:hypothetical protein